MSAAPPLTALIRADLRERPGVRYAEIEARRLVQRGGSELFAECFAIDPYRGCSFGCRYCFARFTPEYLRLDPVEFERRVFAKLGAAGVLERELARVQGGGLPIAIGVATDPYQPAEARYRLTRGILEVLARGRGLRVALFTKSALVASDIDVLLGLARRSQLSVHVSLACADRHLARVLEPGAPPPERRLAAVRALAAAGVPVGVDAVPILPGINDRADGLRCLFEAAAASGAGWLRVAPLSLPPAGRRRFLAWLRTRMPEQWPRYREYFARDRDADPTWQRRLRSRVAGIRAGIPLPERPFATPPAGTQPPLPGLGLGERLESRSPRGLTRVAAGEAGLPRPARKRAG